MNIRSIIARAGAWAAGIGAVVGYFANWMFLPAVECTERAYVLTCATLGDRILHILGNFGSVLAALLCALPGLVIYFAASSREEAPPEE